VAAFAPLYSTADAGVKGLWLFFARAVTLLRAVDVEEIQIRHMSVRRHAPLALEIG
jgi:hypothetical protein